MNYRNREFKQLQKTWYKKLEKAGFEDEEKLVGNDMVLQRFHSRIFKQIPASYMAAQVAYYQLAAAFLYQYDFDSSKDELLWRLHSEGVSAYHMVKIFKITERGVRKRIEKLRQIMISESQYAF